MYINMYLQMLYLYFIYILFILYITLIQFVSNILFLINCSINVHSYQINPTKYDIYFILFLRRRNLSIN